GVRTESMAVYLTAFIVAGIAYFSNAYSVLSMSYSLNPAIVQGQGIIPLKTVRVPVPGVGLLLTLSLLLLLTVTICFLLYLFKKNEGARRMGHLALRASLVTQGLGICWLLYEVKHLRNLAPMIDSSQLRALGEWLAGSETSRLAVPQLVQGASSWL